MPKKSFPHIGFVRQGPTPSASLSGRRPDSTCPIACVERRVLPYIICTFAEHPLLMHNGNLAHFLCSLLLREIELLTSAERAAAEERMQLSVQAVREELEAISQARMQEAAWKADKRQGELEDDMKRLMTRVQVLNLYAELNVHYLVPAPGSTGVCARWLALRV